MKYYLTKKGTLIQHLLLACHLSFLTLFLRITNFYWRDKSGENFCSKHLFSAKKNVAFLLWGCRSC